MVSLLLFHPLCGLHLPFVSNIVLSNFERRLKNWDSDRKGSTIFKFVLSTIFGSFSKSLATSQNFTVANLVLCLLILFYAQTLNIVKINFACTQALSICLLQSLWMSQMCVSWCWLCNSLARTVESIFWQLPSHSICRQLQLEIRGGINHNTLLYWRVFYY